MTLKTSSFKINQTILRKNMVRFWPIWALYIVYMIFMMPVALYTRTRYFVDYADPNPLIVESDKTSVLLAVIEQSMHPVPIAICCIVAAVAVFSYLYTTRSCNMMHAFPVKRTELFATNYISGILFLIIPELIAFFASLVVFGVHDIPGIQYLVIWLLMVLGMSFFFYSLSVLCCMLTGHLLGGFAFYIVFNLIYVGMAALIVTLASEICYGLRNLNTSHVPAVFLSPLFYLYENIGTDHNMVDMLITDVTITGGKAIALYCIPAIVFIILAVMLYGRRNLECAAEISAHRFVKPLIRWIVTIPVSIGLAYWFAIVFFEGTRQFLIVWCIVLVILSWACFFILEMVINKKFKVFKKKRFLEWAVCIALMLVAAGLTEGDAFGIEKRVPDVSEVEGVVVYANHEMVLTEPDEIQRVIDAHQTTVLSKEEYENAYYDEDQTTANVEFEYILKNGDSFTRRYFIPDSKEYMSDATSTAAQIRSLQEDTNSYLKEWMLVNYEDVTITGGSFYQYTVEGDNQRFFSEEEAQIVYEAIVKDIEENNVAGYIGSDISEDAEYYNAYIDIYGVTKEFPLEVYAVAEMLRDQVQKQDEDGLRVTVEEEFYYEPGPNGYEINSGFDLRSTCEYTIQALIQIGVIDSEEDLIEDEKFYQ